MRQFIITFAIFILLTQSCKQDTDPNLVCSVSNPVEGEEWLAAQIREMSNSGMSQFLYVTEAKYKHKTVFIFGNCCPYCSYVIPVYDCSGEKIGFIGNGKGDINPSILNNDMIIWKADSSACNF